MPAHTKKTLPKSKRHIVKSAASNPILLVILAFVIGFCAHILFSVIFAETKDGQIHACVKKNGEIRIVTNYKDYRDGRLEKFRKDNRQDKNGCQDNETVLDWNIQGPPGPAGNGSSAGGSSFPLLCPDCTLGSSIGDRLKGRDLSNAVLTTADFDSADVSGANFTNANLEGIIFSNANLSQVNFENANLNNAKLDEAKLDGVNWKNTVCPDGSNSDANSNTCDGHYTAQ